MPYLDAEQALCDAIIAGDESKVLEIIQAIKDQTQSRRQFHQRLRSELSVENSGLVSNIVLNFHLNEASPKPSLSALNAKECNYFLIAVKSGHLSIAKIILHELKSHSDILFRADKYGDNCFHYIIANQMTSLLPALLELAAQYNSRAWRAVNSDGDTPIHLVLKKGRIDVDAFNTLLQYAKSKNQKRIILQQANDIGDTLLHLACRRANTRIIRKIINATADWHLQNNAGETPLQVIPALYRKKTLCELARMKRFVLSSKPAVMPDELIDAIRNVPKVSRAYRSAVSAKSTLQHLAVHVLVAKHLFTPDSIAILDVNTVALVSKEARLMNQNKIIQPITKAYEQLNYDRLVLAKIIKRLKAYHKSIREIPNAPPHFRNASFILTAIAVLTSAISGVIFFTCPWGSEIPQTTCDNIKPITIVPFTVSLLMFACAIFLYLYRNKVPRRHELTTILDELQTSVISVYQAKMQAARQLTTEVLPIDADTWTGILSDVDYLKHSGVIRVTSISHRVGSLHQNLKSGLKQMNRTGSGFTFFQAATQVQAQNDTVITIDDERPPPRRQIN